MKNSLWISLTLTRGAKPQLQQWWVLSNPFPGRLGELEHLKPPGQAPGELSRDSCIPRHPPNSKALFPCNTSHTDLDFPFCIQGAPNLLLQEGVGSLQGLVLHRQLPESQLCLLLGHALQAQKQGMRSVCS